MRAAERAGAPPAARLSTGVTAMASAAMEGSRGGQDDGGGGRNGVDGAETVTG
jgi:hypothetical protein